MDYISLEDGKGAAEMKRREEVWIVEEEAAKGRIDMLLAERFGCSRSFVQQIIKQGLVTIKDKVVKANYKVAAGEEVTVVFPEPEEIAAVAENIPLSILFEDEHMIVINKPRGMVVHPAAGNHSGTLVNALLYHCKEDLSGINGQIRPGIVHRLDKDTSGVMVAAKEDEAHMSLAKQIKNHEARRTYLAIVHGNIVEEKGTIDAPIGRHPKDRLKMAVTFQNSREAVTHFTVKERFGLYTLIECRLETGRTHQIRVHMAHIGHPIVNDPVYGYRRMEFPIQGQALHSYTLHLTHPTTGEVMEWTAPIPQDFLDCITYAKEHRK